MKRIVSFAVTLCLAFSLLSGAVWASGEASGSASGLSAQIELTEYGPVDMTRWQYNEANDVYWQVGVSYCEAPADASYENLGIYVPGAYLTGTPNGDYGEATTASMKLFQNQNGLEVNGVASVYAQAVLYSSFALSFYVSICELLFPLTAPLTSDTFLEFVFAVLLPIVYYAAKWLLAD